MATAIQQVRAGGSPAKRLGPRISQPAERALLGSLFIVGLIAVWTVVTALGLQPPILLPSPWDVIAAFKQMFSSPQIWDDFAASGQELFYGFFLASAVGITLGLAIGWYARLGYLFDPFINLLYAIPRVALGPLLIVWLGIGLSSKIALVFLTAVFPVLLNTCSGIRSLDSHLVRVARCFGAGDMKIFWTIALPGSVPFILGGLRLAVGQALIGVFVAELLGAQNGIGMLIENAGEQFQTAKVFAGLIIFAVAGLGLTAIVRRVERHFDAWRM